MDDIAALVVTLMLLLPLNVTLAVLPLALAEPVIVEPQSWYWTVASTELIDLSERLVRWNVPLGAVVAVVCVVPSEKVSLTVVIGLEAVTSTAVLRNTTEPLIEPLEAVCVSHSGSKSRSPNVLMPFRIV